ALPFRTARRNARLPGAAIALGQGAYAGRQETAAFDSPRRRFETREGRSVYAPDAQHFLSADDRTFGADAAGDDRALLHGRVADGVHRLAAHRGVVLVDLAVLRDCAARAVSQALETVDSDAPHADRGGGGADHRQHAGGARSAIRHSEWLCAHAQIRHRRSAGQPGIQEVSPPQRVASLRGDPGGHVLCGDERVRYQNLQFLRDSLPSAVRRGLLLGGFRHPVPGILGAVALAQAAKPGTGPAVVAEVYP